MDQTYNDLAERVLQKWELEKARAASPAPDPACQCPQRPQRPRRPAPRLLVALAGPPGSGKTTIAAQIVDRLNNNNNKNNKDNSPRDHRPKTIAISADGFHLPLATLRSLPNAAEALARRGAPWTFDGRAVVHLVQRLRRSAGLQPVRAPTFDHAAKDPVADGLLVAADVEVCILEGNYLLCDEEPWLHIAHLVDERWLVHVEPDLAVARVASRHLAAGIEPTMETAMQRARANDMPNGDFVMARSKGRYDLLVESVEEEEEEEEEA